MKKKSKWRKWKKQHGNKAKTYAAAYPFSHGHIARQMRAVTIHY